jgi:predicted ATPase
VEPSGGYYAAQFQHRFSDGSERWFNAAQESDGTLRLAGIITALIQRPAPPLIGIEEPELTINPGLLPLVFDHLKASSKTQAQVIITTHSPELLDQLDLSEIRVVRRSRGVTSIGDVAQHQRAGVRDELITPGEILRSGGFQIEGASENLLDELLHEGEGAGW